MWHADELAERSQKSAWVWAREKGIDALKSLEAKMLSELPHFRERYEMVSGIGGNAARIWILREYERGNKFTNLNGNLF